MQNLSIQEMTEMIKTIDSSLDKYYKEVSDGTIEYDSNVIELFKDAVENLESKCTEIFEDLECSFENNYEIFIYDKVTSKLIADFSFYADNDMDAHKIYEDKYKKDYPVDKFTYEIEYLGGMNSDRGYEMKFDANLYK